MTGRERTRWLAVRADDPVMSVAAPLGLAAAIGTALVIDLEDRLGSSSARTLADIATEGPRLDETRPGRKGIAVIRSGGLGVADARDLTLRLASSWPAVVVRLGGDDWPERVVPVCTLFPGLLAPLSKEPAVWQRVRGGVGPPGPGPVLPILGAGAARRILSGGAPLPGRWVRAWRVVWEAPWA
jgi:hypothetical protein